MSKQSGVTLLELMVGIAVAAILAMLAAPSFNRLIASTRLNTQTTELLSSLQYARTEALNRNQNVSVCRSPNPAAAPPACGVSNDNGTWATGWLVFTDGGAAGVVDGTDQVLRVGQPAIALVFDVPPRYSNWLGFSATGRPRAGVNGAANGTIILCNGVLRRAIRISIAGRISRIDDAPDNANCSTPIP